MGTVTLLQLEQNVLNLLNETFDSTAGDLRAGGAGGATIPTVTPSGSSAPSTIKTLLNEAAQDLVRSCFPVIDTGTMTWPQGVRSQPFTNFTATTSGNVLWIIRGAAVQGQSTALRYADRAAVERSDPNWMLTTAGTPLYWYYDGNAAIGLYPTPSTSVAVTVDGFVTPAPLAASTDTLSWLPDDLSHLLVWYAADMVARKNMEDQALSARSDDWREWRFLYDTARQDLWSKIPVSMRHIYPTPPITARPMPPMPPGVPGPDPT